MSFTKVLFAFALITVCAAAMPCYGTAIPSSSVTLTVPALYGFRAMIATFTPPGGLTLSAYEKKLGYTQFDWTQKITNWPNADLKLNGGVLITPVPPLAPIGDPPAGGYSYNPCNGPASGSSASANPFYYTPPGASEITDCWSLTSSYNEPNSTTLRFADEPMDSLLTSMQISANNIPKFMTALVGICGSVPVAGNGCTKAGAPSSPQFAWTWQSTYSSTAQSGGVTVTATSANSPDLNAGDVKPNGTMYVTITGICVISHGEAQPGCEGHGEGSAVVGASAQIPVSAVGDPVPEPSGSLLLASGMLAILAARRIARSKKETPI